MCWLQKHCSCKAPEHAVPLQRGQGGTSPNWSSQILGHPTLPSLGGEFLAFQIFKNFQITINISQLVFPKTETAKSGQVQKCDPFRVVCKAGSKISPGGRQGRDVCRPEGCWEHRGLSILPWLSGESHSCCFTGLWWKSQAACMAGTAGHRSPSLSCHSPGRTAKPGPPALPLLSTERLASPRFWFLWQQNCSVLHSWALCSWGYTLSAEQLPHAEHRPRTQRGSEPPAALVTYKWTINLSAQCSHSASEKLCHIVEV